MANSGWTNDAVDTLTVPTGAVTGKRVVIANQANGDAIDVYDAGGNLVYAITGQGAAESINPADGRKVTIFDGAVQLLGANGYVDMFYVEPNPFTPSSQPELFIEVFGPSNSYTLILEAESADGTKLPTMTGSERNIQGSIVQMDTAGFGTGFGNLMHVGFYTGTVVDAFGNVVIPHGALFTPQVGQITHWDVNATGQGYQLNWFQNPFTFSAGNMAFFVRTQTGAVPPIGTVIGVHATLFG